MATYGYLNIKQIIADFYRDVKPSNSDWVGNASEWVGFALGEVGAFNIKLENKRLDVENHKVLIPCDAKYLKSVTYGGIKIPKKAVMNIEDYDRTGSLYYSMLNSKYIETSFSSGEIIIYYYTIEKDAEGYPLIPDDGNYAIRNYVREYILMKWLMQGNTHPVRKWDEVRNGIYTRFGDGAPLIERARNSCNFPSFDGAEMIKDTLMTLVPDMERFTQELHDSGGIDLSFAPKSTNNRIISTELITPNEGYETPE